MNEFFAAYGLFLAQLATVFALIAGSIAFFGRRKSASPVQDRLRIVSLNERHRHRVVALQKRLLPQKAFKQWQRQQTKHPIVTSQRRHLFVLDFVGDMQASGVAALRQEVDAILAVFKEGDQVLVRLESSGGLVSHYGLAAAQLARLRDANLRLTIAVDRVAASGGYLMAAVAHHILAAPFALVGSIGVVAQVPNVHRALKRNDVDVELFTAGEYKRTVTVFGENTDVGRAKLQAQLDETHGLFKQYLARFRPSLDLDQVATGEAWYGESALTHKLVDEIGTSDDFLMKALDAVEILQLRLERPPSFWRRLRGDDR